MKTSTLKIATLLIALTTGFKAEAQEKLSPKMDTYNYSNAIGIRVGETSGLTFKHHFSNNNAFEGIISAWPYSIGLTGLFEKVVPTGTSGLNFYYGAGAHVNAGRYYGRRVYYYRTDRYVYAESRGNLGIGVDGIVGLEYKIRPIPFAISADLKPYIETNTNRYTYLSLDPSIGIKVTF